ncbi:MAG: DbpA RNA binding domain-containing protein, partial [Deltaproteobacteria bacterium]|nr:DbpA RNA binding domain-containing protein [Nannocystaceae bacterium]
EAVQGRAATVAPLPEPAQSAGWMPALRSTLCIHGGRRHKLRAGDVLGALTRVGGIAAVHVGKIDVAERTTYVAVDATQAARALAHLERTPIKGRRMRVELASQ